MTTRKKILISVATAMVLLISGAAAWIFGPALLPPKAIDVGIAVNSRAPIEMPLKDSAGKPTSLAREMGPEGMVLFLVRSADWCPFCKAQLVRTNDIGKEITSRGYGLASLSYDRPEILANFATTKGLSYRLLSDVDSHMIDALGLRDPQYDPDSFAYGVPRATILILGTDGTVKAKYVSEDFRSRPSNDDVLAMLNKVDE